MALQRLAEDLMREFFPATLAIGMVVKHPSGRMVQITSGQYMGTHGLSNFWSWREVLANGQLSSTEENGYGWDPKKVIPETFSWCGCCEHYHRESFHGDCRQDDERFTRDEIVEKFPGARIYDQEEIVEVKGT